LVRDEAPPGKEAGRIPGRPGMRGATNGAGRMEIFSAGLIFALDNKGEKGKL